MPFHELPLTRTIRLSWPYPPGPYLSKNLGSGETRPTYLSAGEQDPTPSSPQTNKPLYPSLAQSQDAHGVHKLGSKGASLPSWGVPTRDKPAVGAIESMIYVFFLSPRHFSSDSPSLILLISPNAKVVTNRCGRDTYLPQRNNIHGLHHRLPNEARGHAPEVADAQHAQGPAAGHFGHDAPDCPGMRAMSEAKVQGVCLLE